MPNRNVITRYHLSYASCNCRASFVCYSALLIGDTLTSFTHTHTRTHTRIHTHTHTHTRTHYTHTRTHTPRTHTHTHTHTHNTLAHTHAHAHTQHYSVRRLSSAISGKTLLIFSRASRRTFFLPLFFSFLSSFFLPSYCGRLLDVLSILLVPLPLCAVYIFKYR